MHQTITYEMVDAAYSCKLSNPPWFIKRTSKDHFIPIFPLNTLHIGNKTTGKTKKKSKLK